MEKASSIRGTYCTATNFNAKFIIASPSIQQNFHEASQTVRCTRALAVEVVYFSYRLVNIKVNNTSHVLEILRVW